MWMHSPRLTKSRYGRPQRRPTRPDMGPRFKHQRTPTYMYTAHAPHPHPPVTHLSGAPQSSWSARAPPARSASPTKSSRLRDKEPKEVLPRPGEAPGEVLLRRGARRGTRSFMKSTNPAHTHTQEGQPRTAHTKAHAHHVSTLDLCVAWCSEESEKGREQEREGAKHTKTALRSASN
jgi:hypothetical protein